MYYKRERDRKSAKKSSAAQASRFRFNPQHGESGAGSSRGFRGGYPIYFKRSRRLTLRRKTDDGKSQGVWGVNHPLGTYLSDREIVTRHDYK
jgi:hypothetical protein